MDVSQPGCISRRGPVDFALSLHNEMPVMVELALARAQEWDRRWQAAVLHASGPARGVSLRKRELLKTGETGALTDPGALFGDEVAWDDEADSGRRDAASSPRRGTASWLHWLAAQASTWQERLHTSQMALIDPVDERLVQGRLRRWADRVTPGDAADAFERFIRCQGLDLHAARRAVAPAQLRPESPLPDWAVMLGEALFTPCCDAQPGACDPERPIPFEALLLPFLHIYHRCVEAAAPAGHKLLMPAAHHGLARSLLLSLSMWARDAFHVEFCRHRLTGFAPLAPFVWGESDVLYSRFVTHMRTGGLAALFEAYPVLGRQLAVLTDLYAATVGEFLRRLEADLPEIRRTWEIPDPGPVTEVAAGLSDPHRGGRQVFSVTFAHGLRLIYKPKDLGIDVAYNALLAWLNAAGAPVTLRPLRVLDRHTHGWVECVDPAPCPDSAAVTRYYQRAGALLCLVHLLQGSDCHAENLIAAGEHPVLVDCETLLDPWPRAADRHAVGERQRASINHLLRDSVLTSGLLPAMGGEDERTYSTPGLCRTVVLRFRGGTNRWLHINTDRMAVSQVMLPPAIGDNLPRLGGVPAEVEAYAESLVAGFSATYRYLVAQQPAFLAPDGPLAAFRGRFVRFVFRATHLYTVLFGLAMRRAALADGVDYGLVFELLARPFLVSDETQASWPILAAEREALLRGDVPFFGARTDQSALLLENGERIEDYFARPSYDAAVTKLRNLNEQDLAFQVGLIRAAIAIYVDQKAQEAATAAQLQAR